MSNSDKLLYNDSKTSLENVGTCVYMHVCMSVCYCVCAYLCVKLCVCVWHSAHCSGSGTLYIVRRVRHVVRTQTVIVFLGTEIFKKGSVPVDPVGVAVCVCLLFL